ncbi:hypothetical protein AM593_01953, partial [Mytilus galloprovincialis]
MTTPPLVANLVPKPEITTIAVDTTYVTNPDCDLRPVGKSTYQKYEKAIDAWVTEDCHVGLVFNVMLCHCVKDGVVVTGLPVTSTKSYTGITNSTDSIECVARDCPYVPVNQRSYKEYVADIGAWVTNDCPSDMVFNVVMCSCHPEGSADIIVVPITTVPPLNIPTVPNCPYKKSDDGYLEYIPEMKIWLNNACPIDHGFVVEYCTCLSQSDISKIPEKPSTTTIKTSTTSTSVPSSMTSQVTILLSSPKSELTSTPSSMTSKATAPRKLTSSTTASPETTTATSPKTTTTATTPKTKTTINVDLVTTTSSTTHSVKPTSPTTLLTTTERTTTTIEPSPTTVQTTTIPSIAPTTTRIPSTTNSITTKPSIKTTSETIST